MALDAGVVGANIIELGRVHDVSLAGIACVVTARTMASFTTDIPFDWCLRLYVVVDGMAAITQRSCWAPHVGMEVKRNDCRDCDQDDEYQWNAVGHIPGIR